MKKSFLFIYAEPGYLFDDPVNEKKFKNGRILPFILQTLLTLAIIGIIVYLYGLLYFDIEGLELGWIILAAFVWMGIFPAYIGLHSIIGLIDDSRARNSLKKELKTLHGNAKRNLVSSTITMKRFSSLVHFIWLVVVILFYIFTFTVPQSSNVYLYPLLFTGIIVSGVFILYLFFIYFPTRKKRIQEIDGQMY